MPGLGLPESFHSVNADTLNSVATTRQGLPHLSGTMCSSWRGYSDALGLYVCWEDGFLKFYDPETEGYLRSHQEAESRVAELEAELRRLRGE